MSVVGEVVGIIACVAGVISAYKDGGAIIKKIKVKRAIARAAPPFAVLEQSIDQAPEAIEAEKHRGIQRFGKAFEHGDHIAVIALQQITIQLQGSLLEKLRHAAFDDAQTEEFVSLADAADLGRDSTVGALHQLKQRLLVAGRICEIGDAGGAVDVRQSRQDSGQGNRNDLATSTRSPDDPVLQTQGQPRQRRTSTWRFRTARDAEDAAAGADSTNNEPHVQGQRQGSRAGLRRLFHRHDRTTSISQDSVPEVLEEVRQTAASPSSTAAQPPPICNAAESSGGAAQPRQSQEADRARQPFRYIFDDQDDPTKIWGSTISDEQDSSERRDTVTSLHIAPDARPSASASSPSLPTRTAPTNGATTSPQTPNWTASLIPLNRVQHGSTSIPTPSPENEYLGFCKSAWKLQNGDRKGALTPRKEFNDGWSSSDVKFLACSSSKCAFAGRFDVAQIWDRVWYNEAQGLKFRWQFLAKSHVMQQKVKDHQYVYQCLFCVYQGKQGGAVYAGTDTYLLHVSQEHRGQALGEVIRHQTKCINDCVAKDSQEFDINLFPLTTDEVAKRSQSAAMLSDDLSNAPAQGPERSNSEEATDSAYAGSANEPWSGDLSNFHWSTEFENV